MERKAILSVGGLRSQIDNRESTGLLTGLLTNLFIKYVSLLFTIFYTGLLNFKAYGIYAIITDRWVIIHCF